MWKRNGGRGTGSVYSLVDRLRMMQLRQDKKGVKEIAKEVGCTTSTIVTITADMKEQGYVKVRKRRWTLTQKALDALKQHNGKPQAELVHTKGGTELHITPAPRNRQTHPKVKVEDTPRAIINGLRNEVAILRAVNTALQIPGGREMLLKELEKSKP